MAKTTYIVNPGYSLEDSLKQYREGNYPGAVLYGITILKKMVTSLSSLNPHPPYWKYQRVRANGKC